MEKFGSRMEKFGSRIRDGKIRIRDPGWKNSDPGSGMVKVRIRDPGSATLVKLTSDWVYFFTIWLQVEAYCGAKFAGADQEPCHLANQWAQLTGGQCLPTPYLGTGQLIGGNLNQGCGLTYSLSLLCGSGFSFSLQFGCGSSFSLTRILILLLIKVLRICDHWFKVPPGLHF